MRDLPDRINVIRHDGSCCSTQSSRTRLKGRSLPGRQIDQRHPNVDKNVHPLSIPGRLVHTGDMIIYFTGNTVDGEEQWIRATIKQMTIKMQLRYPTYYNVLNELGQELCLECLRMEHGID